MKPLDIASYNRALPQTEALICELLAQIITDGLAGATSKLWHAHPVWFLDGNPIVGYSHQKAGIRLMFWSGMGFDEPILIPGSGKFKDASLLYTAPGQIDEGALNRMLAKSAVIQWDYKNIVRKRRLDPITPV